jgi:hypothetical protein
VFTYVLVAVSAWYYPNPQSSLGTSSADQGATNSTLASNGTVTAGFSSVTTSATAEAAKMLFKL